MTHPWYQTPVFCESRRINIAQLRFSQSVSNMVATHHMCILVRSRDEVHEDVCISRPSVKLVASEDEIVIGGCCWIECSGCAVVVAVGGGM